MRYWVRVKVKRPGQFTHDAISERELPFLPLDPLLPPPMLDLARRRAVQPLNLEPNARPCFLKSAPAIPVPASSVLIEATLPTPSILCTQRTVPLQLFIKLNTAVVEAPPLIALRTLRVAIRTKTNIIIGSDSATWTSSKDMVHIAGHELQLIDSRTSRESLVEVSSDFWKDAPIPNMTQSFTTCTVGQQHWLVVTAGFSYSSGDTIYV